MFDTLPTESKCKMSPPKTQCELMARCQQLTGKTLGQVSAELGWVTPTDLRRHKGWVGALIEAALGADAGNQAEPDFTQLAIELKTLPINKQGQPKESTYVCTVSMQQNGELNWHQCWLRRKLSHVLWVPIEADIDIPLAQRYIGQAILWTPSIEQEAILQRDWESLMDRVVLGEQSEITAKEGDYLQIRPKAANSHIVATGISDNGLKEKINPKGFYLRTSFTKQLLQQG